MGTKFTAEYLGHAKTLFDGIRTIREVAEKIGCNPDSLSKHLRATGFTIPKGKPVNAKRKKLPTKEIVSMYISGVSELEVAKHFGISRGAVRVRLVESGVKIRNQRESSLLSASRSTFEQRQNRAKAAQDARRGAKDTHNTLRLKAVSKSESFGITIGPGEDEFAEMLNANGINFIRQKPVDIYNVDFMVGGVAVELKSGTSNLSCAWGDKKSNRIKNINKRGHSVVYVCFRSIDAMIKSAKDIIALIDRVSGLPSGTCENWMIGCRLQDYTIIRNDMQQFTRVASSEKLVNTIRRIY